jgi:hypothetical protein
LPVEPGLKNTIEEKGLGKRGWKRPIGFSFGKITSMRNAARNRCRLFFPCVRCRWCLSEQERDENPTGNEEEKTTPIYEVYKLPLKIP